MVARSALLAVGVMIRSACMSNPGPVDPSVAAQGPTTAEFDALRAERDMLKTRVEELEKGRLGSPGSTGVIFSHTPKPEHEAGFLQVAEEYIRGAATDEPDTLVLFLARDRNKPGTYVWIELYKDAAAQKLHGENPRRQAANAKMKNWFKEGYELIEYEKVLPR